MLPSFCGRIWRHLRSSRAKYSGSTGSRVGCTWRCTSRQVAIHWQGQRRHTCDRTSVQMCHKAAAVRSLAACLQGINYGAVGADGTAAGAEAETHPCPLCLGALQCTDGGALPSPGSNISAAVQHSSGSPQPWIPVTAASIAAIAEAVR